MLNKFPERLKEPRMERKLTQQQLSKELNVSQPSIARWEAGLKIPSLEILYIVAKYFDVSADFLIGLSDFI